MLQTMLKLANMMAGVEARTTSEHIEFLEFYESLVRGVPPAASKAFGNMQVEDVEGGKPGIELTPVDYGWWREAINNGTRFKHGVSRVKRDMYDRMCKSASAHEMTAEERAEFIDLLKQH